MKISAAVIKEALSSIGNWHQSPGKIADLYSWPRLFAGNYSCAGHICILSPDELTKIPAGGPGILFVLTAPLSSRKKTAGNMLIPSAPVPKEEIWNCLANLYDHFEQWDAALSACGSDLAGIRGMLALSADEMKGDFVLIDVSYNVPAYTGTGASDISSLIDRESGRMTEAAIASLAEDPQLTTARTARGVRLYESDFRTYGAPSSLYRNMFRKGEKSYYNRLIFLRLSGEYSETDRFMLEVLAQRVELITGHLSTYAVSMSGNPALKQQLVRASYPTFKYNTRSAGALSSLGWKNEDEYQFFIFRSLYKNRDAGITDYMLRHFERLLPGSCAAADGELILLIRNITRNPMPFSAVRSALADFLRENLYKTGVSNHFHSFSLLRGAYLQAEAAMTLGSERDPMFWYYLFEDYLEEYIIQQVSKEIPAEMLVLPALAELIRHDRERGTSYAETLRVLAEENYNTSRTAKRLFIHRSTLQDRLERLHQIVDIGLDDSTTRALIWLGFQITG